MRTPETTAKNKKRFLIALAKRFGIVSLACDDVGINRATFYDWKQTDEQFALEAENIREREIGSIAEDRLAEAIIVDKNVNMVKFYLQARVPKYKPKQEVDLKATGTVSHELTPKSQKIIENAFSLFQKKILDEEEKLQKETDAESKKDTTSTGD